MSFKDLLQDSELARIDAQHTAADGATTDAMGTLAGQIAALRQEVARQNVALTVLTQMLIERGGVDASQLKARFDQGMSRAAAEASLFTCPRCKQRVDKRRTQITASGTLCDDCYRAVMLEG